MKKFIIFLIILILVLACGGGFYYAYYAQKYDTVFYEGTKINGEDLTDKGVDYITSKLIDEVDDYSLKVKFRDNREEELTYEDLGLQYDPESEIREIFDSQEKYRWYRRYLEDPEVYYIDQEFSYDEETIKAAAEKLPEFHDEDAPKDAYITLKENFFEIVPEEEGEQLNKDVVKDAIFKAVENKETFVDITGVKDAYIEPRIRSDNPDLNAKVKKLNLLCTASVTYILKGDKTQTADSSLVVPCFTQDDKGEYKLDTAKLTENCKAFLEQMAKDDDTTSNTITWRSTNKGEMTMYCQDYGHVINVEAELTHLVDDLANGAVTEREPEYSLNKEAPAAPSTYVEVDIDLQKVYYYENGVINMQSDCVSGTASDPKRATPKGFFSIYSMEKDRDLKGRIDETGAPEYISHVGYWMPFNGGVGLHDAPWRSEFGGEIYKTSGSHGCINLPNEFAAALYEKCYVGMPVMVV